MTQGRLSREHLRSATQRVREDTGWRVEPRAISPAAHDAANELLGRPKGTPLTTVDLADASRVIYDRATPEERVRLTAAALRTWS